MKKEKIKSASAQMSVSGKENTEDNILDRDRPGPVSVAHEAKDQPGTIDPIDPHLSAGNPPESASGEKNVEDDALDRDKPGPVSVSPEGKEKPSYTHNADKSDPIDPNIDDNVGSEKRIDTLKGKK